MSVRHELNTATEYLTDAIAAHTSIFRVNTVSSVSVVSAVGQSWLSTNTGKIVQIDGASSRAKGSIEHGSVVYGRWYVKAVRSLADSYS